jgi:hypothetical protein
MTKTNDIIKIILNLYRFCNVLEFKQLLLNNMEGYRFVYDMLAFLCDMHFFLEQGLDTVNLQFPLAALYS